MRTDIPQPIKLADYRPPDYLVDDIHLDFDLATNATRVKARMAIRRNGDHAEPLRFNGERLKAVSVAIDGRLYWAPTSTASTTSSSPSPRRRPPSAWRRRSRSTPRPTRRWRDSMCPPDASAPSARPRASARSPGTRTGRTCWRGSRCGSRAIGRTRACSPTATCSRPANCRAGVTTRCGTTRSPSPATCSPSSPASSTCWRTASSP